MEQSRDKLYSKLSGFGFAIFIWSKNDILFSGTFHSVASLNAGSGMDECYGFSVCCRSRIRVVESPSISGRITTLPANSRPGSSSVR